MLLEPNQVQLSAHATTLPVMLWPGTVVLCMLTTHTKVFWVKAVTSLLITVCQNCCVLTFRLSSMFLDSENQPKDHMHALQMLLCRAHLLSSRTERAATAIVVARRQHRPVLQLKQSVRAANTSAGVNSNPSASKPRGMKLKGSCHCGAVSFEVESKTPQPFMHCYCTICRKTQGGGGYTINIMVCVRMVW